MKVIDSFMFFNEINILKLRLNYLNDVVDYFIISEASYTHAGKPKPYYLDEVLEELPDEIVSKIIRIKYEPDISQFNVDQKIDCCDLETDFWKLERSQRNLIETYLSNFSPNDLFMISDADEIPRKETVKEYKEVFENYFGTVIPKDFMGRCSMLLFYFNFNTYCRNDWLGTTITRVDNAIQKGCNYLRSNPSFYSIENGGFHFSSFGDLEHIRTKIQSFAHQEYNNEKYTNDLYILNSVKNKEDIWGYSGKFKDYDISELPEDLRTHIINIFPREMYME